uniref:Programmed cell death protein 5 n=1 Tax=Setaria digitata TaxID=48799 RepID=A0A915PZC8_9BILA
MRKHYQVHDLIAQWGCARIATLDRVLVRELIGSVDFAISGLSGGVNLSLVRDVWVWRFTYTSVEFLHFRMTYHNVVCRVTTVITSISTAERYLSFRKLDIPRKMADDRLAKLQENKMGGGAGNAQAAEKAKEAAEQEENMKNAILSQVLDQNAMARLSNLSAAKPEKAKMVENMIVQMARRGQLVSKMDDETLRQLLSRFSEHTRQTTTVKEKILLGGPQYVENFNIYSLIEDAQRSTPIPTELIQIRVTLVGLFAP